MAAVRSEVRAICGAKLLLPSQRFKLWDEAAAPTVGSTVLDGPRVARLLEDSRSKLSQHSHTCISLAQ